MSHSHQPQGTPIGFMIACGLMIAHQVAGKAVRDGLFLSQFPPSDLPKVVGAAAVVAVLAGLGFARLLSRYGPVRLAPAAFAAGSLLHVAEFAAIRSGGEIVRVVVITAIYLHLVSFGAILLSGFWSVANEFFDPREAKVRFGRIAGAGTVGGIAGGLAAERGAALLGVDFLLLFLAGLHLAAGVVLWRIPSGGRAAAKPDALPAWAAARNAFRQAPFLMNLALLVLLGTMSAAMLDYLFKSTAATAFGKGPTLTRYFALFYAANQVVSFALQTFATPAALRRLGLGRTVRWHPAAVAAGAGAALLGPPLFMAPMARSLELVLRGSFLRSGYELFFTPVPAGEKRAVKTFIDVACDRIGDALGALILQLLLLLGPQQAAKPILLAALVMAILSIRITSRMDAAYSDALERGLLNRALAINQADIQDSTTLSVLMKTSYPHRSAVREAPLSAAPRPLSLAPPPRAPDSALSRLADLRSGDPARVAAALRPDLPFEPLLVPQTIRLLAWNGAFEWSRAFLVLHAHRITGQLVDALLDPGQDFAVRRRLPRILAYSSSQRAVDGLTEALQDQRFEIRYHASRALEFLHRMTVGLRFDSKAVMAAVERELAISGPVRQARRLLDGCDGNDEQYWFLDDVLKDRADKSLEHVFSLLALQLPPEPLKTAFRGLHSDDRMLRGLALEYLEGNLSAPLVSRLVELADPALRRLALRPPPAETHAAMLDG